MTEKEELIYLIKESFLSEEEKAELLRMVEEGRETKDIFKIFDDHLVEEVNKRAEKYEGLLNKLNSETDRLDNSYESQVAILKNSLKERLAALSPTDFHEKGLAWDDYYISLEGLQDAYLQKLGQIKQVVIG